MFYCRLELCCGECYIGCLQFECFPIDVSIYLCVLCLIVLVNCLLNTLAICVGEVNVFSLKVIGLFLGCFWVVFGLFLGCFWVVFGLC